MENISLNLSINGLPDDLKKVVESNINYYLSNYLANFSKNIEESNYKSNPAISKLYLEKIFRLALEDGLAKSLVYFYRANKSYELLKISSNFFNENGPSIAIFFRE